MFSLQNMSLIPGNKKSGQLLPTGLQLLIMGAYRSIQVDKDINFS
jgi:hypothetical protein